MAHYRLRKLGTLRFSAGQLVTEHDVTMTLADGDGIGWVLRGELHLDSISPITFECPWDPDYKTTLVYVLADAPVDAIGRVLAELDLTADDLLQVFD